MSKKTIAILLACAVAVGMILVLSACITTPQLPTHDANVTITSQGAQVRWKEVDNAQVYEIYYSPSRFGNYEYVTTQASCSYIGEDIYGYYRVVAMDGDNNEISSSIYSYEIDLFGANTHIYAPTDDQTAIQADIDRFKDSTSQFGEGRFAALFKEGKYNDLDLQMRYYMTFAGLGELPTGVEIGNFYVNGELSGGNSTCNFWCGIENMTVNNNVQWAVSQATSFRRMNVIGNLTLHDARPGSNTPWASGGFISDTVVHGNIDGSVQQQWFIRNSDWSKWSGGDINMVFAGCSGTLSNYNWGNNTNGWVTYLDRTNVMSEKPYIMFDDGYYVCVPELKYNSKGISWLQNAHGYENNYYLAIDEFYVARSDRDNAASINAALKNGKHILFTPGIYSIESPLIVENPNTILMGIGLATLKNTDANRKTIMRVSDVDGVRISGIMFDAGPYADTLLEMGSKKTSISHEFNPSVLNDVFFRIGGASNQSTFVDKTFVINSNSVVGDNFWVWRADHGSGVGWYVNRANNGVIVNGDNVTIYGLMVEHFQQYQTIWNGENGFMAFYQSETPYDPLNQADWMSKWNGVVYEGYASYKVADTVQKHTAYGLGVYYVASSTLHNVFNLDHAIELPSNSGISVIHMATANFLSYGDKQTVGGIRYIVNSYGKSNFDGSRNHWQSFIAGVATP